MDVCAKPVPQPRDGRRYGEANAVSSDPGRGDDFYWQFLIACPGPDARRGGGGARRPGSSTGGHLHYQRGRRSGGNWFWEHCAKASPIGYRKGPHWCWNRRHRRGVGNATGGINGAPRAGTGGTRDTTGWGISTGGIVGAGRGLSAAPGGLNDGGTFGRSTGGIIGSAIGAGTGGIGDLNSLGAATGGINEGNAPRFLVQ